MDLARHSGVARLVDRCARGSRGQARGRKDWLPLPMEGSFSADISLASTSRLDFAIAFGKEVDASLRLATIDSHLILGTADDFEIVRVLEDQEREWSGILEWDASQQTLTLMTPRRGSDCLHQRKDSQ